MKLEINLNEENRDGYLVTQEMKKIWEVELDLLKKVIEVCKKNNLKIFADSGTLLGTIRHNGFVPWDDDIDLAMLREDYNKLLKIGPKEFTGKYFFQTEETDPGSLRFHIQIRNSQTTGILKTELEKKFKFNQGIFIDIFPLDAVPNNKFLRMLFVIKVYLKKKISWCFRAVTIEREDRKGLKGKIIKILSYICRPIYKKYGNIFYKNFEKYIQKYNKNNKNKYITDIIYGSFKEESFYKKEYYSEVIFEKFENIEIPVPKEYVKILDGLYGEWRVPKKNTNAHGDVFFDVTKSYKYYIN